MLPPGATRRASRTQASLVASSARSGYLPQPPASAARRCYRPPGCCVACCAGWQIGRSRLCTLVRSVPALLGVLSGRSACGQQSPESRAGGSPRLQPHPAEPRQNHRQQRQQNHQPGEYRTECVLMIAGFAGHRMDAAPPIPAPADRHRSARPARQGLGRLRAGNPCTTPAAAGARWPWCRASPARTRVRSLSASYSWQYLNRTS
jgi:hypothetical protein